MNVRSVRTWLGIFIFVLAALQPGAEARARPASSPLMATASEVISAVNALRTAHGLPPYSVSSILMGTAQAQADFMASTGQISHTGPGGVSVTSRLLAAGYPLAGDLSLGGFRSENIVGSPGMTAEGAVSSWTGDDLHLHTMLSADLQEIGAGVAENDGVTYFVIDCARPTGSGVPVAYTPGAEAALSGGDDIIVPVSMSTPDPQGNLYHEVQAGQSLWQIAIAYGVKIADIQKLNSLGASTVINRGQKLLIKHVDAPMAGPPTSTVTAEPATATAVPTFPVPTTTLAIAPTVVTPTPPSGSMNAGVAVAAIAIVALLSAVLVAWVGRARPI